RIPRDFSTAVPARRSMPRTGKDSSDFRGSGGGGEVTDSSLMRQRAARCRFPQTPKEIPHGHDEKREEEGGGEGNQAPGPEAVGREGGPAGRPSQAQCAGCRS